MILGKLSYTDSLAFRADYQPWDSSKGSAHPRSEFINCIYTLSPGEGNGYPLQYSCLENSMERSLVSDTTEQLTYASTQLLVHEPRDVSKLFFVCVCVCVCARACVTRGLYTHAFFSFENVLSVIQKRPWPNIACSSINIPWALSWNI